MGFTGSRVKPLLSLPASLMKGFEQALLTKVISTEVSSLVSSTYQPHEEILIWLYSLKEIIVYGLGPNFALSNFLFSFFA